MAISNSSTIYHKRHLIIIWGKKLQTLLMWLEKWLLIPALINNTLLTTMIDETSSCNNDTSLFISIVYYIMNCSSVMHLAHRSVQIYLDDGEIFWKILTHTCNGKFSILVYDFSHTSVWKPASVWKIPSANEKSLYVCGIFKSLEEKPYFRMGYLRLFFTV